MDSDSEWDLVDEEDAVLCPDAVGSNSRPRKLSFGFFAAPPEDASRGTDIGGH